MRTTDDVRSLIHHHGHNPLQLLEALDGFYECPIDSSGNRQGPLVGYTGRYDDRQEKQYVGDVYANFAKAEEWPEVMQLYADAILAEHDLSGLTFCGAPMGGITLAQVLALRGGGRYVFAEKKATAIATKDSREKSELVFARHQVHPGERVVICEDVMNNFSTTNKLITLIEAAGAQVVAIVGLLNRSLTVESSFPHGAGAVPVMALVRKPYPEYKQEDPKVAADVARGNVVWEPKGKGQWDKLRRGIATAG